MSAPWHAEAARLRESGMSYQKIADAVGRAPATVREALCPRVAQDRAERKRRIRRSTKHAMLEVSPNPIERADNLCTARAYMRPDPSARPRPSLPIFSLPPADPEPARALRIAPKTRLTGSPGAERWREIHRRMIRAGKLSDPAIKAIQLEMHQ